MQLIAKGEHILIEPLTNAEVQARQVKERSGLILRTDVKQGYPNLGRVYSIGDECPKDLDYKVGDLVFFDVGKVEGIKLEGISVLVAHWKSPQATIMEEDL